MSDIILPPSVTLPEKLQLMDKPSEEATDAEKASALPQPTGWRLLCAVPDAADTFDGSSIIKADRYKQQEEIGTAVLFVLRVGPDAYKDPIKFPDGKPWCKEGDFVLVRTYSGTRVKIFGKEFRLIADDQVEAVVEDPRGISRIGA